jgi:hypothetical protein
LRRAAGVVNRAKFCVLVCVVVLTAVVHTVIAQRWFAPDAAADSRTDPQDVDDEEFEPARRHDDPRGSDEP